MKAVARSGSRENGVELAPFLGAKKEIPVAQAIRCFVGTTSRPGPDGLEGRVLYVRKEFMDALPKLAIGERIGITLKTPVGSFHAGLRAESSVSSRLYVCPDLTDSNGNGTSLARVLEDCHIGRGQDLEVTVQGGTWEITKVI